MIVRQPLWLAVGWIHADNVIADDKSNDADAGTSHGWRAVERQRPAVLARRPRAPLIVPLFPFPDTSAVVGPDPASNGTPPPDRAGAGAASTVVAVGNGRVGAEVPGGVDGAGPGSGTSSTAVSPVSL